MILFCSNVGTLILFCSFAALPFLPFHPATTRATIPCDQLMQEHGHGSSQNPSEYFHTLITRSIPNYCRPTRRNAAANNIMKGGAGEGAGGGRRKPPARNIRKNPAKLFSRITWRGNPYHEKTIYLFCMTLNKCIQPFWYSILYSEWASKHGQSFRHSPLSRIPLPFLSYHLKKSRWP